MAKLTSLLARWPIASTLWHMASSSASTVAPASTPSAPNSGSSLDEVIVRLQSPIAAKEVWKLSNRIGMSAEQFERLTEVSPHRLRRGRDGETQLEPEKTVAFARCAKVFRRVLALCNQDEAAARTWLNAPAPTLKNKKPIEAAETNPGSKNVEALIAQLEKAAGIA